MAELHGLYINGGDPNHLLTGMILQVTGIPTFMVDVYGKIMVKLVLVGK